MHGKKIPRAHKLPKVEKKQTNKHTIIQNGPCRCGHCQQEWEGREEKEKEKEGEEEKCLIARLGKQNELVLTTHLGICVLTLWQLEEPLKAAAEVKKEVRQGRRVEGQQQWANCCFASGLKFNWLV